MGCTMYKGEKKTKEWKIELATKIKANKKKMYAQRPVSNDPLTGIDFFFVFVFFKR